MSSLLYSLSLLLTTKTGITTTIFQKRKQRFRLARLVRGTARHWTWGSLVPEPGSLFRCHFSLARCLHWSLLLGGSFWGSSVLTLMACHAIQQGIVALWGSCELDLPDHPCYWPGKAGKTRTLSLTGARVLSTAQHASPGLWKILLGMLDVRSFFHSFLLLPSFITKYFLSPTMCQALW